MMGQLCMTASRQAGRQAGSPLACGMTVAGWQAGKLEGR